MAAVIPFPVHRLSRSIAPVNELCRAFPTNLTEEALRHVRAAIQILETGNEEERRLGWILEDCTQLLAQLSDTRASDTRAPDEASLNLG